MVLFFLDFLLVMFKGGGRMYSLPISTYSDYWRATKVWSSTFGCLAVFAAGTRYSVMTAPDITQTLQPAFQQTTQTLNNSKIGSEISRGGFIQGEAGLEVVGQRVDSQGAGKLTNKIEVVDIEIPYTTQYVESAKVPRGKNVIQEKGETGILRQVVKTFEVDGQISDQQVQSSFEIKSPKKEVVFQNTKPIPKIKVIAQNSNVAVTRGLELPKMDISCLLY